MACVTTVPLSLILYSKLFHCLFYDFSFLCKSMHLSQSPVRLACTKYMKRWLGMMHKANKFPHGSYPDGQHDSPQIDFLLMIYFCFWNEIFYSLATTYSDLSSYSWFQIPGYLPDRVKLFSDTGSEFSYHVNFACISLSFTSPHSLSVDLIRIYVL